MQTPDIVTQLLSSNADHKDIKIRTVPFSGEFSSRAEEKQRRNNAANQARPRFHQKQMFAEEALQRKVEGSLRRREASFGWLVGRVREGRMELLTRSRCGGVEREARMLWSGRGCTLPGKDAVMLSQSLTIGGT